MVRLVLCVEFRIYNIEMRKVGICSFHWPPARTVVCWHQAYILFYLVY